MNPHLNVFLNYKEVEGDKPKENNLTRAFIITLKNEPQLLRDFFFLINAEYSWDEVSVSLQNKNIDVSGFETVVGVTLTTQEVNQTIIDSIEADGNNTPIPDFLIYNSKTLIVGEVKKHSENAIAQLKNQVDCLIRDCDKIPNVLYRSLTWTDIMSKLILPHLTFHEKNESRLIWAREFKDYIATHYSDWLPVPTLNNISFAEKESVTFQFIQKRLYFIQTLTIFKNPQWIGNRMTLPLDFHWATEALVKPEKYNSKDYICITIWPADTKKQGNHIFNKKIDWINQKRIPTSFGVFDLVIAPYIKFAHVMGKYISAIEFNSNEQDREYGKMFHTKENFKQLAGMWHRDQWPDLIQKLDTHFKSKFDWKSEANWEENFENSGRNYVFISMGFSCSIYIPFQTLQDMERKDQTGQLAANLISETISNFRSIVDM